MKLPPTVALMTREGDTSPPPLAANPTLSTKAAGLIAGLVAHVSPGITLSAPAT